jgi:hypothetical protein
MRNLVSFGVTFGFGFNFPPLITKEKRRQVVPAKCSFPQSGVIALVGLL